MADLTSVQLAIAIGTLAALVYTLRSLVLLDRKVTRLCERQGVDLRDIDQEEGRTFSARRR